jgi:hypothetical protein
VKLAMMSGWICAVATVLLTAQGAAWFWTSSFHTLEQF